MWRCIELDRFKNVPIAIGNVQKFHDRPPLVMQILGKLIFKPIVVISKDPNLSIFIWFNTFQFIKSEAKIFGTIQTENEGI